jgi:D-alanyl-D-alanine carboxypeptidase
MNPSFYWVLVLLGINRKKPLQKRIRQWLETLRRVQSYTLRKQMRNLSATKIGTMSPPRFRPLLALAVTVLLLPALAGCAPDSPRPAPTGSSGAPSASPTPQKDKPKSFFNKKLFSVDDPTSIWVVNNKLRPLNPQSFVPPDLVNANVRYVSNPQMRAPAAAAIAQMFAVAAAEGGGQMQIQNAYRSYATQLNTHDKLVASLGEATADSQSARAGYSEHQTGLVADIAAYPSKCDIATCFGDTPQGKWLAANAYRFGFILRYPADKTPITGYVYEPWHFRYVGVELSTYMHETGVETLEEFFGLPPAPNYAP